MKNLLIALFLVIGLKSHCQSASNDFSFSFETNPTFTAGMDIVDIGTPVLQVRVSFSDISNISEVFVKAYPVGITAVPGVAIMSGQEINSGTFTDDGKVVFNLVGLDPANSYEIILEVQDLNGGYLPVVKKIYTPI